MSKASALRNQIEASLAKRIPSALTPVPRLLKPLSATGITKVDELLEGGLPLGAITEMNGPECSGRTSLALSFVAQMTQIGKVCAWIDVSDTLDPLSAAAIGVDLQRLLWVRCGVIDVNSHPPNQGFALPSKYMVPPPVKKGLHGGGHGPHPRTEIKGMSHAIEGFMRPQGPKQNQTGKQPHPKPESAENQVLINQQSRHPSLPQSQNRRHTPLQFQGGKPWRKIEQALKVTDLILQAGGFSALVLDLGSIAPQHVSRIPLATWFRYRAAAERSQASILLLTQHACARSSAGLGLTMEYGNTLIDETTVFAGIEHRIEIKRERFAAAPSNLIPLRKPPQRESGISWQSRSSWAGRK